MFTDEQIVSVMVVDLRGLGDCQTSTNLNRPDGPFRPLAPRFLSNIRSRTGGLHSTPYSATFMMVRSFRTGFYDSHLRTILRRDGSCTLLQNSRRPAPPTLGTSRRTAARLGLPVPIRKAAAIHQAQRSCPSKCGACPLWRRRRARSLRYCLVSELGRWPSRRTAVPWRACGFRSAAPLHPLHSLHLAQ